MPEVPALQAAVAQRIRLVGLDVDGVLTDGGLYLGATASGERTESKRFEITDGLGIRLLQESGIQVAIITGRVSHAVRIRAEELGITECHQDPAAAKLPIMEAMLDRLGIGWEEAAFVGDDLPDLPVLRRVGLPVAVANAVAEVRAEAQWITRRAGGHGAVRDFAEALLRTRGEWNVAVERYLAARGDA
ncbi:MAG: HAD hydrolase family protein [Gemmatimonadota bacterium]|nr:HAD hydrolase family protein [Gemmatimonadota bacterium]